MVSECGIRTSRLWEFDMTVSNFKMDILEYKMAFLETAIPDSETAALDVVLSGSEEVRKLWDTKMIVCCTC